jgi:hypothetical protein
MEPECLLQCSQDPGTGLCTEPDKCIPHSDIGHTIFTCIIPQSTSMSATLSLIFRFPDQHLYEFPNSSMRSTYSAYLIIFHFINLIISDEEYKL